MNKIILLSLLWGASLAQAKGSEGVGGGDLCESRIQEIRSDLQSWIIKGGHQVLNLKDISHESYAAQMLTAIASAKVRCVSAGDNGYPVEVNGTAKECRFDVDKNVPLITCDRENLNSYDIELQYQLIHHEYAGIAKIEKPMGDISNYEVSRQISIALVDQMARKLAGGSNPTLVNIEEPRVVVQTLPDGTEGDVFLKFKYQSCMERKFELVKNVRYPAVSKWVGGQYLKTNSRIISVGVTEADKMDCRSAGKLREYQLTIVSSRSHSPYVDQYVLMTPLLEDQE